MDNQEIPNIGHKTQIDGKLSKKHNTENLIYELKRFYFISLCFIKIMKLEIKTK